MLRWAPLLLAALCACRKPPPPERALRAGETRVALAGVSFGITLPAGIAMREDDPAITGEPTKYEELAEGFAAFQTPRQSTLVQHATSWFLSARPGEEIPATREQAVRLALDVDPALPPPRLLGAEELEGGGLLVSTISADRIVVHVWRPNGKRPWHCGGEDFRDANFVAPPSWLDDPQLSERARAELEAPCRSARTL